MICGGADAQAGRYRWTAGGRVACSIPRQIPVNPCGLLYGMLVQVTSSSDPSGCTA